jgi:hypothetical protein
MIPCGQAFRWSTSFANTDTPFKGNMERGEAIVIVDLRSDLSYHGDGAKVPGAIWIPQDGFKDRYKEILMGCPVVMYCT